MSLTDVHTRETTTTIKKQNTAINSLEQSLREREKKNKRILLSPPQNFPCAPLQSILPSTFGPRQPLTYFVIIEWFAFSRIFYINGIIEYIHAQFVLLCFALLRFTDGAFLTNSRQDPPAAKRWRFASSRSCSGLKLHAQYLRGMQVLFFVCLGVFWCHSPGQYILFCV